MGIFMDFYHALVQFEFLRNAVFAGILASIACGIMGALVTVNRIVFISGGLAHTAYGGVGIAYFFGFNPTLGAMVFSVFSAFGFGIIQQRAKERSDTLIGMMWAVGMAIGILFIDASPGYKADLMSYLFGSILAVPRADLAALVILDAVIVGLVSIFYKDLLAFSYDEEFAKTRGLPVQAIHLVLLVLIAITVVLLMRVVGLIMVIALLSMPAALGGLFSKSLHKVMLMSCIASLLSTMAGLFASFYLNLTSGAAIILCAASLYGMGLVAKLGINQLKRPARTHDE